MSRLLVSVRSPREAEWAVAAGVDLVDVKEPARGSLGRPDAGIVAAVVATVAGRRPVSVALGELLHDPPPAAASALPQVAFAKIGLAGCALVDDWPRRWRRALQSLPAGVGAVAVVYADWQAAQAPPPHEIVERGAEFGCRAALVDTFDKSAGGLLSQWSLAELDEWTAAVQSRGLVAVLAGRLGWADVDRLLTGGLPTTRPDFLAVRSAVCAGPRDAELSTARLAELAGLFRSRGGGCLTNRTDMEYSAVQLATPRAAAG